jgi:hypothetical protein
VAADNRQRGVVKKERPSTARAFAAVYNRFQYEKELAACYEQ